MRRKRERVYMSWSNGRLSFSALNWWRQCPKAFNHTMSSEEQRLNKNIKKGAAFGNKTEALWDKIFQENWLKLDQESVEDRLLDSLMSFSTEDALKIRERFNKSFKLIKGLVGEDYAVELQSNISLNTEPFISYGKLDYVFTVGNEVHIVDAKASTAKKASYLDQLKHYSFLWWEKTGVIPKAHIFYTKKAWLVDASCTEESLLMYKEQYHQEISDIHALISSQEVDFEAKVGNHCFMCGFTHLCEAKKRHDELKNNTFAELREGELWI